MTRRFPHSLITVLLFLLSLSIAVAQESNTGIIYGLHHAFSLSAPKGWVLDNKSGVSQGLYAVFYPVGSSWKTSVAVMYARGIAKENSAISIKTQVELTLRDFRENGSLNISARFVKDTVTEKGKNGSIYYFNGDRWGNHEAVAYFEETKTINFIVLTSRTKDAFDAALGAFEELAKSYMFITDQVKIENEK
jgi:hypothetical protein